MTCDMAAHGVDVVHRRSRDVTSSTGSRSRLLLLSLSMLARWTCHHPFSTSPGASGASSPDDS